MVGTILADLDGRQEWVLTGRLLRNSRSELLGGYLGFRRSVGFPWLSACTEQG